MSERPLEILVVCTANQCRSPLGEYAARAQLDRRGIAAVVESVGTAAVEGVEATDGAYRAGRKIGLDLGDHLSRLATAESVAGKHLVIAMERAHVVHMVTELGADVGRTFTLPELALAATAVPRRPGERLAAWFDRIEETRHRRTMLDGPDGVPEIDDPTGWGRRRHLDAARQIDAGLTTVFDAMYGAADGR